MTPLHTQYLAEIKTAHAKLIGLKDTIFSDEDLLALPEPVGRYFRLCGYLGTKKRLYGRISWEEVRMRFSDKGRWHRTDCYEFLAAPEPLRIAHLKMRVAGLIPINAIDKYQGGHGNMLISAANLVTLQDVKGAEMDQSALVTFLSECLLLPAIALQPYIRWSSVSDDCALATISFSGIYANGFFHFNQRGEFILFETECRWKTLKGGKLEKVPWRIDLSDYKEYADVRYPGKTSASWVYKDKLQEYFTGKIGGIS